MSELTAGRAYIVGSDMLTPYGRGVDAAWDGLMSGASAFRDVSGRFSTKAMKSDKAALVEGLSYNAPEGASLVMQMLSALLAPMKGALPEGVRVYLATTKGEIDLLERSVIDGDKTLAHESNPRVLLHRLEHMLELEGNGVVVSAACASSTAALAMAASDVSASRVPAALVVGCDSVSEFVFSGFSSLMAIDPEAARPFDANRAGLGLGEAAAMALIVPEEGLKRFGTDGAIEIAGWGMTSDANHMTGPSRDGLGLARAIEGAIRMTGAGPGDVHSIAAHGTGTKYNDSMEMKAFKSAFGSDSPLPVYSVKGGMGHTMGAAGLVEALLAGRSCFERVVPPTVGMDEPDAEAKGWVSTTAQQVRGGSCAWALTTNSGFGGVNAALMMRAHDWEAGA